MRNYVIEYQCRPIDQWPGQMTKARKSSPFRIGWGQTMNELETELRHLRAKAVVLLLALDESEIRLDGRPRANAVVRHPGVILCCDTVHGPFRMACDAFHLWPANVLAIARSLNALRMVDRYGVTKRGEQYRGWRALPAPDDPNAMGFEQARRCIAQVLGIPELKSESLKDFAYLRGLLTRAKFKTHPDHGGSAELFKRVMAAERVLLAKYENANELQ